MVNAVGSLTQLQKSLIIGTTLGDGYIRKFLGRKNALLEINHSYNQKDYVQWKYEILKEFTSSEPKARKGNGERIAFRFYTKQLPEISEIHKLFYRNNKKIIPDSLVLDEFSLAVWYMDDGSKCGNSNFYLNTQQFSYVEQIKLVDLLRKRFNLETNINKDKKYFRLRFISSSISRFKELISQYVIPSMQYKIGL